MASSVAMADRVPRDFFKMDYALLREWVLARKVRSVDDLLEKLPGGMVSDMPLFRRTRSTLQEVTPTRPRILLANEDASLLVAVTGDPKARGGDTAEVIYKNKARRRWGFASIDFSRPEVLQEDPAHCFVCHHNARPIWDTYPHWVDLYGGLHGHANEDAATDAMLSALHDDPNLRYRHFSPRSLHGGPNGANSFALNRIDKALMDNNYELVADELVSNRHWPAMRESVLEALEPNQNWRKYMKWLAPTADPFDDLRTQKWLAATLSQWIDKALIVKKVPTLLAGLGDRGIEITPRELRDAERQIVSRQRRYYEEKLRRDPRGRGVHPILADGALFYPLTKNGTQDRQEAPILAFLKALSAKTGFSDPSTWTLSFQRSNYAFTTGRGGISALRQKIVEAEGCGAALAE